MRRYNRVMLGRGSQYADQCLKEGFIGADYEIPMDLTGHLPDDWRDFNEEFVPVLMELVPGKTKIGAGLSCGMLHNICKGLKEGDVVLCPNGKGIYYVGEIAGDYYYVPGEILPHRRPVKWMEKVIRRIDMSTELRNSAGAGTTCCELTDYADEIEALIAGFAITMASPEDSKPIMKVALEPKDSEQNYTVDHYTVTNLLNMVQTGEIAIPEIQRHIRPKVNYLLYLLTPGRIFMNFVKEKMLTA